MNQAEASTMTAFVGREEARIWMGTEMKSDSTAGCGWPCSKVRIKVIVVLGVTTLPVPTLEMGLVMGMLNSMELLLFYLVT